MSFAEEAGETSEERDDPDAAEYDEEHGELVHRERNGSRALSNASSSELRLPGRPFSYSE